MNWYYVAGGGQRQGPVSDADLQALIESGKIFPATLVWREGMTDWAPLEQARIRPADSTPSAPPVQTAVSGDTQRCDSCGSFLPPIELIQLGVRRICAQCKPRVLQQIQSGSNWAQAGLLERNGPAWEHRDELGLVAAAWATIKSVLSRPSDAFTTMKREGGPNAPMLYHVLLSAIGSFAGIVYQCLIALAGGLTEQQQRLFAPLLGNSALVAAAVLGGVIFIPICIALFTVISAAIVHLSLMICGGAKQPFETTFRVTCYASGSTNILQVVPFCGGMVAAIWGLIATCIGLAKAHEITVLRAVLAVLLPGILCCVLTIFGIMAGAGLAAGRPH
jgi:hypothetical protein